MKTGCKFSVIFFNLFVFQAAIAQTDSSGVNASPIIYDFVEQSPEFPGGPAGMMNYLSSNIIYPDSARAYGIQGTVYVRFIVTEKGKVTDVKVVRGIGGGCDEAAVRVIQNMPDWLPGRQNGKPVAVRYTLPIKFTLK